MIGLWETTAKSQFEQNVVIPSDHSVKKVIVIFKSKRKTESFTFCTQASKLNEPVNTPVSKPISSNRIPPISCV